MEQSRSCSSIIPVVDLASFSSGNLEVQAQVTEQVARACREWGFFHVVNHGLSSELLVSAAENCHRFFQQPADDKLGLSRCGWPDSSFNGYSSFQGKDSFIVSDPGNPHSQRNVWPAYPPRFRPVTEQLMSKLCEISSLVEEIVLKGVGLSRAKLYQGCGNVLSFNYYPSSHPGNNGLALREHQDGCVLTLLAQLNPGVDQCHSDGLQILKDSHWLDVKAPEGALAINIGDILQVWSNKTYQSVKHRVRSTSLDRYSLAYFHQAGYPTVVKPLPEFTVDKLSQYKPFLLEEYAKLRAAKLVTIDDYAL